MPTHFMFEYVTFAIFWFLFLLGFVLSLSSIVQAILSVEEFLEVTFEPSTVIRL